MGSVNFVGTVKKRWWGRTHVVFDVKKYLSEINLNFRDGEIVKITVRSVRNEQD